jgi:alpha-L-rhamnosidase
MCNFDMHQFYRKAVYDYFDALQDTIFVDTAPYVGIKICGPSWESAFLITQNKLLEYYNDTGIVREFYKADLNWMAKVERMHPSGIVDKGLADHESLVKVPVQLIGTTHYLDCARIMKKFAGMNGDRNNEARFDSLAVRLKELVKEKYWSKPVPDTINRQTLFATLLYYDIVPENERKDCLDSLLTALKKAPSGHFTTGIFGTKYILEELSEEGYANEVFKIINSREWPGWGYMLSRGATTIWETWKESDNVYSNCHPMFGSVSEWFYRWLGGIRPDAEYPGFERFTIAPVMPEGLEYVK